MDTKVDIVGQMLCSACLCVGRLLRNITDDKLKQYYLDTLKEIPLSNIVTACPSVCWECEALLKKTLTFREQVKDSYRILQTYTSDSLLECALTEVSRPSKLKVHTVEALSIRPEFEVNILNPEMQVVFLKEEELKSDDDDCNRTSPLTCIEENSLDYSNKISKLENVLQKLASDDESKHGNTVRKKPSNSNGKVKRNAVKGKKKIVKERKETKKKGTAQRNIRTIDLTYEEMLHDRLQETSKDAFVNAAYKCVSCLLTFNYEASYTDHVTRKHSAKLGDYTCPICKTVVASVDSFTSHYKRHSRRYECGVCGKRTLDRKAILHHYDSTHYSGGVFREYKCKICGKISNSFDTHRYHRESHEARVACTQCDKTFCHRAGLLNHRLAVHKLNNEFPCTQCNKVFRWKTSLKKHTEIHDRKGKPASPAARCEQCDVTFTSLSSYQRHMRTSLVHVTRDQLKFICDDCGRRYSNKTKLRDHIEEKHLFRTYKCDVCQKMSKNRVCLEQHVRNVHRGRALTRICHHCGRGFPTKVQLESHIRSHTGERPFICEICPTTFSQQSNLYKHNRQVHLNIKSKRQTRKREASTTATLSHPTDSVATKNHSISSKNLNTYQTSDSSFAMQ